MPQNATLPENSERNEFNLNNLPSENREKIFTIEDISDSEGTNSIRTVPIRINGDELSLVSTDDILDRSKNGVRVRHAISTNEIPSAYFLPRRVNSTSDFRNYKYQKSEPKKLDKMVLKLVVPGNSRSPSPVPSFHNNHYLSASSMEQMLGNGQFKERLKPPRLNVVNPDTNGAYINRGYSASDLTGSPLTPRTPSAFIPDNPTPHDEKKRTFSGILVTTFSIFYALFNVTVGLALYVTDILDSSNQTAEIFSLYLVIVSFLYITFLIIDISIFSHKKEKYENVMEKNLTGENLKVTKTEGGDFEFDIALPELLKSGKPFQHSYCFKKDRHSTNFYLKIGAAAFCFGHLIHSGTLIGYQLVFITGEREDSAAFYECGSIPTLLLDIFYPIYSFFVLFFIFKYSNIVINKYTVLAKFGMMHCLSSSICFWIWTIMRETLEAIASKTSTETKELDSDETTSTLNEPFALPLSSFALNGLELLKQSPDFSVRRFTKICVNNDSFMAVIYKNISPYLYPFSVEFSILVVGVLFVIWQNIQKCDDAENEDSSTLPCSILSELPDKEGNVVVHADCHSSNKGLFGGFVVLVLTVVSSILFFIAVYDEDKDAPIGLTINLVTSIAVLSMMFLACIFAYRQITKLDFNTASHNILDIFLLFICIPAFFLNGVFSIIPAIINKNAMSIVSIILEICQVLLQTAFLQDGVRRSSNTKKLRKTKPGRELVSFLILANISLWLFQTFEVKAHGLQDNRYDFYGKELWTILGHMCLPLMMFYRFHASVCFVDVWKYAYVPSGH
ncbi:proton channel OtopLc-like [Diabrotica undecimpunctata]|uniref:proton channel OtopLc-like n=1 Tax=Diabrotica undecimpunctata TaxID=50387 RepID=UPI003B63E60B